MKPEMTPSPRAEKSGLGAVKRDAKVGGSSGYCAGKPSMSRAVSALKKQHRS